MFEVLLVIGPSVDFVEAACHGGNSLSFSASAVGFHGRRAVAEIIDIVEGEWIGNGARDPYIYAYYAVLYRRVPLLLFLEDATSQAYDVYCEYY